MRIEATIQLDIEAPTEGEALAVLEGRMKVINAEIIKAGKQVKARTTRQNNALHLYLEQLAIALREGGFDLKEVLKKDAEIPCTMENLKENVWRKVQIAMFNKKSTTELETDEVSKIYEVVDKTISERTGVTLPFPSIESMNYQDF